MVTNHFCFGHSPENPFLIHNMFPSENLCDVIRGSLAKPVALHCRNTLLRWEPTGSLWLGEKLEEPCTQYLHRQELNRDVNVFTLV